MKLVMGLKVHKKVAKKLRKRSGRGLRSRTYFGIEEMIKTKLGPKYGELPPPLPLDTLTKFQRSLNEKSFKSERLTIESITKAGITNFYPNAPLLNRWFGDLFFKDDNLVVELDGPSHKLPERMEKDRIKDNWLLEFGYQVIRVDMTHPKSQAEILHYLTRRLKHPSIQVRAFGKLVAGGLVKAYPPRREQKQAAPPKVDPQPRLITKEAQRRSVEAANQVIFAAAAKRERDLRLSRARARLRAEEAPMTQEQIKAYIAAKYSEAK